MVAHTSESPFVTRDMMTAKKWILWIGLGAFLAVLIGFAVIAASPQVQQYIMEKQHVPETLYRLAWIMVSAPGLDYRYIPVKNIQDIPVIVYDGKNDTWLPQSDTSWGIERRPVKPRG